MTMLIASMDHSPVESLQGTGEWHTTAILLSEAGDQMSWAGELGEILSPQGGKLPKWSRARPAFKKAFALRFIELLGTTAMYAIAVSAPAEIIDQHFEELLTQLQLRDIVTIESTYVQFAPTRDGDIIRLGRSEAAPIIFLCHFILRMHAAIVQELASQGHPHWCDWQISPDNFQHGVEGGMARLFSAVLNSASSLRLCAGNIRTLTFLEGDPGNELADVLAGALASQIVSSQPVISSNSTVPAPGKFYWEQWSFSP